MAKNDISNPKISVVIPVRNCERYLDEAIESALAQNVGSLDVIVIDDGSTDGSALIARRRTPLVRYHWQPASGAGAARNRGVESAAGEFLAFLDADDRWPEHKLELQLAAFVEDPALDMVFGQVRQLHDGEEWQRGIAEQTFDASQLMAGIVLGTLLVRRKSFLRVGPLRTDYRVGEFIDWQMRATEQGLRAKVLPDLLLWRRIHGSNLGIRERQNISDYARVLKSGLDRRRALRDENR
jgi:glycosyltransferase involved in cell wall biosynthesis